MGSGPFIRALQVLWWRRRLVAVVAIPLWLGATLYARSLPDVFQSTAVVSFTPETGRGDDAYLAVTRYAAFTEGDEAITDVAGEVGIPADSLDDGLVIEQAPDDGRLEITVRSRSRRGAALAASSFASQVVEEASGDQYVSAEVIADAALADTAAAPPRVGMSSASLLLGLLCGAGASLVAERISPRVRQAADVSSLGTVVLARLPRSQVVANQPRKAFSDSLVAAGLRTLRAHVMRVAAASELVTIFVTSPTRGDGKSTVAGLLAEALARVGQKVLLVDADLPKPALSKLFGLDAERGLAAVLRGTVQLQDACKKGWVDNLSVLATRRDLEAADLLAVRMPSLLSSVVSGYEVVVMDGPPMLDIAESKVLARSSDGVVLVAREGRAEEAIGEALAVLAEAHSNVLGIVLNFSESVFEGS